MQVIGSLDNIEAEEGCTLLRLWLRWIPDDLHFDFLYCTTGVLHQARENFHVAKCAAQREISLLCPLVHALHVELRQNAPINLIVCLKKCIQR